MKGRASLYAIVAGMEACWLYAIVSFVNSQSAGGRLSAGGLLLLFPGSFVINILLRRTGWHRFAQRTLSWIAWTAATLLAARLQLFPDFPWLDTGWLASLAGSVTRLLYGFEPELFLLLISAAVWQLGRRLAHAGVTFATTVGEFQFGLAILLILFFIAVPLEAEVAGAVPLTLTFFVLGLGGMSLAHALEGTSWLSSLYRGRWAGLLIASILLVLLLGGVMSAIVDRSLIQVALDVLNWIWEMTLAVLLFLVSLFPESEPPDLPPEPAIGGARSEETFHFFTMPEWLRESLRLGWSVLMVGLFLLALWRISTQIIMWLHRRLSGAAGTEFESLPGALKADVMKLLRGILWLLAFPFRARRRVRASHPELPPVRRVYRELLRWAGARGYPRKLSQTPQEYSHSLAAAVPSGADDLRFITEHYVGARYGTEPVTPDALCKVKESWGRLKQSRVKKAKPATEER